MQTLNIRTIKITDCLIYASPAEKAALESRHRRSATVGDLANLLAQRKREMAAEQQSAHPNMERIAALRGIINNLQNTLGSVQR